MSPARASCARASWASACPTSRRNLPDAADAVWRALTAFERGLDDVPWFAAAGSPLDESETQESHVYLKGLGLEADIATVGDWTAGGDVVRRPDFDPDWWDGEERLRAALMDSVGARTGPDALHTRLTRIARIASDRLQGAASVAMARDALADAGLAKSAAGAASIAVNQAALAAAADASADHPFVAKFRLFEAGRWPLGVYAGIFYVF